MFCVIISGVYRRVVEGRGGVVLGVSECSCVWRLSFVVDNCSVVATEHSRYGLSCMYVETIECMSSAGSV